MGMVFCRGCAKEIHESATTCPHCGAVQTVTPTGGTAFGAGGIPDGLLIAGYILAVFFPVAGFGIGIYALIKGRMGHGLGMLGVAMMMSFMWMLLILA